MFDLEAKSLADSQTSRTAQNENHPFPFLLPRSQARTSPSLEELRTGG
jgi:hypothetical protein